MSQLQRQLRICHVQWWAANALPMPCSTVCRTIPHIVVMLTRAPCLSLLLSDLRFFSPLSLEGMAWPIRGLTPEM